MQRMWTLSALYHLIIFNSVVNIKMNTTMVWIQAATDPFFLLHYFKFTSYQFSINCTTTIKQSPHTIQHKQREIINTDKLNYRSYDLQISNYLSLSTVLIHPAPQVSTHFHYTLLSSSQNVQDMRHSPLTRKTGIIPDQNCITLHTDKLFECTVKPVNNGQHGKSSLSLVQKLVITAYVSRKAG